MQLSLIRITAACAKLMRVHASMHRHQATRTCIYAHQRPSSCCAEQYIGLIQRDRCGSRTINLQLSADARSNVVLKAHVPRMVYIGLPGAAFGYCGAEYCRRRRHHRRRWEEGYQQNGCVYLDDITQLLLQPCKITIFETWDMR
jgi:hypothetical protein